MPASPANPNASGYLLATRHPWPSLVFLLPLLAVYEGGVMWLGGNRADSFRNGADAWLRWGLEAFGFHQFYAAPAVVIGVLLFWSWWRWKERPGDLLGTTFAMAFESFLWAIGLWLISRNFGLILDRAGLLDHLVPLSCSTVSNDSLARIITFVGAGIYEEVLFRLGLYCGLYWLFRLTLMPGILAILSAMLLSTLAFAAAHHIGPYGEPMDPYVFSFRVLAGLYFVLIYQLRGFGVAVGSHAGYDVLVGVSLS